MNKEQRLMLLQDAISILLENKGDLEVQGLPEAAEDLGRAIEILEALACDQD